jgi:hypothetical protein
MTGRRVTHVASALLLALVLLAGLSLPFVSRAGGIAASIQDQTHTYLPLVLDARQSRRVNAPFFNGTVRFSETAIFWFGRITRDENYADVRVGYTASELYLYIVAFDRRIWYDTTPTAAELTQWDAATLVLDMGSGVGERPAASSYRFDGQFSWSEGRTGYQAAYRGNGAGWASAAIPFTTVSGWRGDAPNNNNDDRGWALTYHIPFVSLGLAGPPPQGAVWRLALALHDRDSAAGPAFADKIWPDAADITRSAGWGQLYFGTPTYTMPAAGARQTYTIRNKLNGQTVVDGDVGGGSTCGEGLDLWTEWGAANYFNSDRKTNLVVQNQSDIADWPCFSKTYITFPLNSLPAGKAVIAATLTLHQFGGSDPTQAQPSLIQISTVAESWSEATLSWNNAPLAAENVGAAWVAPISGCDWPCVPRSWDISRAVADAYAGGRPLSLAFYSADSEYHSGKFFVSSDTGDWNAVARPTLIVTLGDPATVQSQSSFTTRTEQLP